MGRTGHYRYRRIRESVKREQTTCHLCGQPIDMTLEYPHPESWSADHVIPVSKGGTDERSNLLGAHLRHNMSRGARSRDVILRRSQTFPPA